MATLLRGYDAGDGYDIEVELVSGARHVFHFASGKPEDAQSVIDEAETAFLAAVAIDPITTEPTAKQVAEDAAAALMIVWPVLSKAEQDAIKLRLQPITAVAVVEAL
jgi:hypothetical protein